MQQRDPFPLCCPFPMPLLLLHRFRHVRPEQTMHGCSEEVYSFTPVAAGVLLPQTWRQQMNLPSIATISCQVVTHQSRRQACRWTWTSRATLHPRLLGPLLYGSQMLQLLALVLCQQASHICKLAGVVAASSCKWVPAGKQADGQYMAHSDVAQSNSK